MECTEVPHLFAMREEYTENFFFLRLNNTTPLLHVAGDGKKAQNNLVKFALEYSFLTAPKLAHIPESTFKAKLISTGVIHLHAQPPRITRKNVKGSREVKHTDTTPH